MNNSICNYLLKVDSNNTARIQEMHLLEDILFVNILIQIFNEQVLNTTNTVLKIIFKSKIKDFSLAYLTSISLRSCAFIFERPETCHKPVTPFLTYLVFLARLTVHLKLRLLKWSIAN